MMRIVFRVDADHKIGLGHLVRCLALADRLKQRPGAEIIFVTANDRDVRPKVEQAGYSLAAVSSKFDLPDALKGEIIIVDIRTTEFSYMEELRSRGKVLVTFDDLGQGRYAADLVVDANLSPEKNQMRIADCGLQNKEKQMRLKVAPRFLLGPGYIILRKEFTRLAGETRRINPTVRRILVSMGGSDPNNLTLKALRGLSHSEFRISDFGLEESRFAIIKSQSAIRNPQSAIRNPKLVVEVVIGPAFQGKWEVRDYPDKTRRPTRPSRPGGPSRPGSGYPELETRRPASGCPELETRNWDVRFTREATVIHELMWEADLAIASAGVTMYELACCGTPAIIIAQDSVQAENTRVFSEDGAIVNLGVGTQVKEDELARVVADLISDEAVRLKMSMAGRALVDGKGLFRVIKEIEEALSLE